MRSHFNIDLKILLLPKRELTEIPLKTFSRFSLDPLHFDSKSGALVSDDGSTFENLPQGRVRPVVLPFPSPSSFSR